MSIGSGLSGIGGTVSHSPPPSPPVGAALRAVAAPVARAAASAARSTRPTVGRGLQSTARTVARRPAAPVRRAPQAPARPVQLSSGLLHLANVGKGAPSVLTTEGPTLSGKTSWFGGPNDSMAGPTTASGLPVSVPGIAVYNPQTLGGKWKVDFPNGRSVVLPQTDIGPAPSTGRVVDVLYSALPQAGYTEGSFPTDATIRATYLGKR